MPELLQERYLRAKIGGSCRERAREEKLLLEEEEAEAVDDFWGSFFSAPAVVRLGLWKNGDGN